MFLKVKRAILLRTGISLTLVLAGIMSAGQIGALLTGKAHKGAAPATLWNLGFQLFYRHSVDPRSMAENLAQAYDAASGKTEAQKQVFKKASAFWKNEAANWEKPVISGQNKPGYRPPIPLKIPQTHKDPPLLPMSPAPRRP